MGTYTRAHTFTSGELLTSANLNGELNGIVSVINGSIDAGNVDATAIPTLTGTQTLTNKTLTSPKVGTNILDTNGNELVVLTATGSAVNEVTLANAATGNSPTLTASGGDANINLTLAGKGTGKVVVTGDLQISGDDLFMATNTAGHLLIGDGTNYNPTALSGDVSVNSSGVTAIGSGVIVDADVNASAAIAQSKLNLAVTTSEIAASTLVIESEGIGSNDNDTTIPTSAAVKDYVDTNVTAQDFDFTTSSGSGAVDLDSQALAFTPGEGVNITHTGQAVTIAAEDATTSNKGVASFATADFSVSSGAVSLQDLTTSHIAAATLVTESEGIGSNDNDTTLPTSAAVKDYVDTNVTAQDFDFTTTSGSGAVDLDSQALAFTPGEGVDITHSGQAVTIAGEDATDANKGVASFASADFSVSSGAVSLVDLTTSHIAAATLVTESEGIGSNDNDTTLPTSAAVKDYVDTQILTEDTIAELNDTNIGTLAAANLLVYDGSDSWDNKAISGDATLAASGALTLAATNTNLTTLANLTTVGTVGTGAWEATDVAVAHGGTGASTASAARTNLGVAIGSNVQAYDAGLASIAGLTTAADKMIYTSGSDTYAVADLSSFARTILDDADAAAVRTTIGAQASDAGLASIAGLTTAADKMIYTSGSDTYAVTDLSSFARTILDDADAAAVRTTIGAQAAGSYAALGANSDITSLTGLTTDLAVAHGGTGAGTFTANGSLLGNGTSAIAASAAMTTNGTLLIGGTGGPEVATLTAGSNVTITNGDGTITIAASGGGGGASAFTDLSDVGSTTATGGRMMVADGDSWESVAVSGDIALAADGTMTIQANSVALATDTTGNYVATVADAGNSHITVANSGAENAAVTLNITDNAVGLAQMAGLARGKIIVGDSSGDPAALAAGSNGQVLTMDSNGDAGWAAAATGGHTIQEEGSALTAQTNLNFVGTAVTATNDAGNNATKVTISASNASLPFTRSDGSTSDPITLTSAAIGESLVTDTSPQLGGDLDVNGNAIVSASNGNIAITPNGSGNVILDGITWPNSGESANYILKTNGSGVLSWVADAGGIASVAADTTPQLGGDLDVNGNSIVSDASNENIPITPHGTGSVVISKADINAGAIDNTTIGATTASTIAGTTLSATGNVSFDGGSFVFNEAGADKDFRIEGDSEANLFVADASTDRIGIGTATPDGRLHVYNGDASFVAGGDFDEATFENNGNCGITIASANDAQGGIAFADDGGQARGSIVYEHNDGSNSDYMYFRTANSERVRINSGGTVLIPTVNGSPSLDLGGAGTSNALISTPESMYFSIDSNNDQTDRAYVFGHNANTTSATSLMVLKEDGSLCIGTSTTTGILNTNYTSTNHAHKLDASHASFGAQVFQLNAHRASTESYSFMACYAGNTNTLEFNFRGDGQAYADGAFNDDTLDYAEYFESSDGAAVELGRSVVLEDNKVRYYNAATDSAENIIGITRPKKNAKGPSAHGVAWSYWHDRFLTDDYGQYIMEDVKVWVWDDVLATESDVVDAVAATYYEDGDDIPDGKEVGDVKTAEVVGVAVGDVKIEAGSCYERVELAKDSNWTPPSGATSSMQSEKKENPDYDPALEENYKSREDRDEWWLIGLLGQVPINANEPTHPNWIKMKQISDAVDLWLVR